MFKVGFCTETWSEMIRKNTLEVPYFCQNISYKVVPLGLSKEQCKNNENKTLYFRNKKIYITFFYQCDILKDIKRHFSAPFRGSLNTQYRKQHHRIINFHNLFAGLSIYWFKWFISHLCLWINQKGVLKGLFVTCTGSGIARDGKKTLSFAGTNNTLCNVVRLTKKFRLCNQRQKRDINHLNQ